MASTFSAICASLWPQFGASPAASRPEGCTSSKGVLSASGPVVKCGEKERERGPVSENLLCMLLFFSHLSPAVNFFLLLSVLFDVCCWLLFFSFYFSFCLNIFFFSIWRLLKFSLFSQSVALLALSWNKIILNRKALLGAQTGIKDSSFNQNIHKHPQTSCTANVSFLIHVKILAIYFQGRIHIALQLLCMKCSAVLWIPLKDRMTSSPLTVLAI